MSLLVIVWEKQSIKGSNFSIECATDDGQKPGSKPQFVSVAYFVDFKDVKMFIRALYEDFFFLEYV